MITLDLEQLARLFIEFEPYNSALDLADMLDEETFTEALLDAIEQFCDIIGVAESETETFSEKLMEKVEELENEEE